ncbi:MAG: DNA-binding beta-propeller fold protein YncE, partial [Myxococcota bacterium]
DAAYGVPAFQQQVNLDTGTYGLAVHPVTGAAYTTTKFGIGISKVTVAEAPLTSTGEAPTDPLEVTAERTLVVSNSTAGRDFGRGLAFNKDGTLAFAAYRTPPSLLVVDTSVDAAGQEADRLLDMIPLPDGPASVAVGNTGPNGRELVYITLFNADKVAVVDPALADVVALIDVGNAPFDLAIVERDDLKRAYVTLFEENAIGVIELDSTSSFYHQEIARIP